MVVLCICTPNGSCFGSVQPDSSHQGMVIERQQICAKGRKMWLESEARADGGDAGNNKRLLCVGCLRAGRSFNRFTNAWVLTRAHKEVLTWMGKHHLQCECASSAPARKRLCIDESTATTTRLCTLRTAAITVAARDDDVAAHSRPFVDYKRPTPPLELTALSRGPLVCPLVLRTPRAQPCGACDSYGAWTSLNSMLQYLCLDHTPMVHITAFAHSLSMGDTAYASGMTTLVPTTKFDLNELWEKHSFVLEVNATWIRKWGSSPAGKSLIGESLIDCLAGSAKRHDGAAPHLIFNRAKCHVEAHQDEDDLATELAGWVILSGAKELTVWPSKGLGERLNPSCLPSSTSLMEGDVFVLPRFWWHAVTTAAFSVALIFAASGTGSDGGAQPANTATGSSH